MPLYVEIIAQRCRFRPGEMYRADVEVTCSNDVHFDTCYSLNSLTFTCHGHEIIDSNWIASKYWNIGSRGKQQRRRITRTLFTTQSAETLDRLTVLTTGAKKRFTVNCVLPDALPPSFKGTSVTYNYELEARVSYRVTTRSGVPQDAPWESSLFKKSFRVIPVSTQGDEVLLLEVVFASNEVLLHWSEILEDDQSSSLTSENSMTHFCSTNYSAASILNSSSGTNISLRKSEINYTHVQICRTSTLTRERSCGGTQMFITNSSSSSSLHDQMYNLRFGQETLVLFLFNPVMDTVLSPGATFGGVLHLCEIQTPNGNIKTCQRISVTLETEEEVNENWKPIGMKLLEHQVIRRLHCECVEYTSDVLTTNFIFTIPSNAPPSFKTPLVSFKWTLKFEFLIGSPLSWLDVEFIEASEPPKMEVLNWELPIVVHSR
eukprot:g7678.t1